MKALIPYLVFPGTCKEAMSFYEKALNGEITMMQTFGDSPVPVDGKHADRVFNAEVKAGNIRIKASDDLPGQEVKMGSNMSLFVVFPDADSKQVVFDALSEKGKILFPLDDNFGMLKDQFGVQWMFVHGE